MESQFCRIVHVALAFLMAQVTWAAQPPVDRPPPPAEEIPDLRDAKPFVVCADCDKPFDPTSHKEALNGLVSNTYVAQLRKALYLQDSIYQFSSRAHFDNCDFESSVEYIDSLLAQVDDHVAAAEFARKMGDAAAAESSAMKAFLALGQALHGVQDFYAHTNYVELSVAGVAKSGDIVIVAPWRQAGKDRIADLAGKGLISGVVFWGFPQRCPPGTPSHAELAKDKATTPGGAVKVPHLENLSRYQIAVQLAKAASQALVDDAFRRWPLLKKFNGQHLAFEVLVDRRGL